MDARILHGSRNPVDLPGLSCQIHTQTIACGLKAFQQFLHNTVCVLNHHLGFGLCWEVKLNKKLLAGHGLEKGEGNEFTVEIVPVFPKPYSSFSKYICHSSCKYSSISLSTLLGGPNQTSFLLAKHHQASRTILPHLCTLSKLLTTCSWAGVMEWVE